MNIFVSVAMRELSLNSCGKMIPALAERVFVLNGVAMAARFIDSNDICVNTSNTLLVY